MKAARTRALNRKHAGTSKHAKTAKHTPTAHKRAATAHKQTARRTAAQTRAAHLRALSPGALACCSAEALAASLRLAGWPVGTEDVLELHWRATGGADTAASIPAVLEAAMAHGLAGVRPRGFEPVSLDDPAASVLGLGMPEGPHAVCLDPGGLVWSWGALYEMTAEAVIEEAWRVVWP